MNYRGGVYPVFNLSQRIGLSKTGQSGIIAHNAPNANAGRSILLLEENKAPFGIIVDTVVKMATLEAPAPVPVSGNVQGIEVKYIQGIVFEGDQEIVILDFERLLHAG